MKTLSPAAALEKARDQMVFLRLARHVHLEPREELVRLGTDYGGYVVPEHLPQADWICYSGGIGEDASFELELIARYGCDVVGFDPTPRSIGYMQELAAQTPQFRFLPIGLWSEDIEQRFHAPRNPEHVSHSIANLQDVDDYFVAECRSVQSVMADLGNDRIDLLKLDIEGAEYEVLPSVLDAHFGIRVLVVEFHRTGSIAQMTSMVDCVQAAGYRPVHLDGTDLTFVGAELV